MPIDANTIAATTDGINQVANTVNVAQTSKRQRKWAEQQYDKQRSHALQDWEMQNAYNSPAAQMQRLKDAGLNPHLVYGNGADATSSAPPRSSDTGTWNPKAYETNFNAQQSLQNYYDAQIKQATTDNLKVQKTVLENEAALKSIQAVAMLTGSEKTQEETTNIRLLRETTIEAARKNIEKMSADIESTKANTFYTLQENMRKEQLQPKTIEKVGEEIKNMIEHRKLSQQQRDEILQRINNMVKDGQLKDWEIKLSKEGIKPGDPLWQRKLSEWLNEAAKPVKEVLKGNFKASRKPPAKDWKQWLERLSPA